MPYFCSVSRQATAPSFAFNPRRPAPTREAIPATPGPPYGVGFTGGACSEPRFIAIAYAFEQATKRRVPPEQGT